MVIQPGKFTNLVVANPTPDVGPGGGGWPDPFGGFGGGGFGYGAGDPFGGFGDPFGAFGSGFIGGGSGDPFGGGYPFPTIGPEYGGSIVIGGGGGGGSGGGSGGSGSARATSAGMTSTLFGLFDWARFAAFLLGIVLVAGGLYLIKPVQNIVNTTAKKGAKAGAMALIP